MHYPRNHQLPEPLHLDAHRRTWLATRGWFGCDGVDWGHRISFPAPYVEYQRAAETAVIILREWFGATTPTKLTVEAGADIGMVDLSPLEVG